MSVLIPELIPGLCSVTFRALGVDEVVGLAATCGLHVVEWGADVHVPPGDARAARRARAASTAAGVGCASYGSYLLAAGPPTAQEIETVLDTAVLLGAPNVRVWAPFGIEPGADLVEPARALGCIATAAAARGLTVSLEFHGGTLTATVASTLALLDAVGATNLFTYWQPPYWLGSTGPQDDVAAVERLGPRLSHLHVYEWADAETRRPLASGEQRWRAVLAAARGLGGAWSGPRVAFCEFVADDDPAALGRDAAVLRDWLGVDA